MNPVMDFEALSRSQSDLWSDLGPSCGSLGSFFGPLRGPLGPTCSSLGSLLVRLGRPETQAGENLKILQTPKEIQCCLPPRALLEGLLELSWKPPWEFGGFLVPLGPSWRALGPSDAFGGRLGRLSRPS